MNKIKQNYGALHDVKGTDPNRYKTAMITVTYDRFAWPFYLQRPSVNK